MQLIERLQYHIWKITEEKWDYIHVRGGLVEYVEDPKNDNQFRTFIKDSGNYARCAFIKGKWYFWPAKHAIHDDFVRSIGLYPYWNQWHKLEVQMNGNSLELGYQILSDWEELVREDIRTNGWITQDTIKILTSGIAMILDLHKKYNLKLDTKEFYRLKSLLAKGKPASINTYDRLYDTERYVDAEKIATKQNKHYDKSLPRKDRLSRIGWKYNSNKGSSLDLDSGDLY